MSAKPAHSKPDHSRARLRAPALPKLLRPKTVRAKTVALLAVPVVSLMALWSLTTVTAVQDAWSLHQAEQLDRSLSAPMHDVVERLQAEREAVGRHLAAPGSTSELTSLHEQTSSAAAALQTAVQQASANIANLAPELRGRVDVLNDDLERLRPQHEAVLAGNTDWNSTYRAYTRAIDDVFSIEERITGVQRGEAAEGARLVLGIGRVEEMVERQDAAATSAFAAARISPEQHAAFAEALGGQRVLTDDLLPELSSADQDAYQQLTRSDGYRALSEMQARLLSADPAALGTIPPNQWGDAVDQVTQAMEAGGDRAQLASAAAAEAASASVRTNAIWTVVAGLVAVLLALAISVRIGRGMVIELVGLRNSAMELADEQLPEAMRRLRAGEKIDVSTAVPVITPGDGEVGQVGEAINAVQHSAMQAAAERAELLTGVSGVFVNLARRNQALVHRQLGLLDAMERRTESESDLEDLFRIDHLATRMRRHAESLIIMSGATPGRAWRTPVPLMDVIRSAVSEVEDYTRVEMRRLPQELSVLGSAVSDVTHLFSELVENATGFSPPDATVLVHGEPVGSGFVVEIEDRGLGMAPDRMAEANQRVQEAHRLELFDSGQLGLFVVSRLAHRQGIQVSLRRSPYGGTTAVVLIPSAILVNPVRDAESTVDSIRPVEAFPEPEPEPVPMKAVATRLPERRPKPEWTPPDVVETAPADHAVDVPPRIEGRLDEDEIAGLPRRKRQENLAPGLKAVDSRGSAEEGPAPFGGGVSPETARSMMSALQEGFARGRGDRADD
ncbi:nitrate- and nitrite sensing domain-containing protein [Saccharopolyspora sp. NPDC049357]|uniref:sensor histidine kinase n=1 Tax=Saccharopolyspora sp. NPDC049357 TaxID=3154507 RepID=UPI00344A9271